MSKQMTKLCESLQGNASATDRQWFITLDEAGEKVLSHSGI